MSVFVTHPTGNRNVRAVIETFFQSGNLARFGTTISAGEFSIWLRILPAGLRQEFLRRSFDLPQELIWSHGWREIMRMGLTKAGLKHWVRHEKGWASVYAVYKDFDKAAARYLTTLAKTEKLEAVYAYEDGALDTFKKAKQLGLLCVYDLPIAYWETGRRLMYEEADRLPEWAVTLGGGIKDSQEKLERKVQEMELADVIVAPGSFVANSIPAFANQKELIVSPFGSPARSVETRKIFNADTPLRVLFVGSMGQRKGLGDLFAAIKLLKKKPVELIVMGSLLAPIEFYKAECPDFIYEAGRPNEEVLALMRSCDVFCLPSIVEGRALVMQEAMSQGLPVIITPNTGGEDLVIEKETGFLVPIRSPESIAEKINWFLDNRHLLPEMSRKAQEHAATYTWQKYGTEILLSVERLIRKNPVNV
jgi:glycosyltransferase involved in cell wall biosynthesis